MTVGSLDMYMYGTVSVSVTQGTVTAFTEIHTETKRGLSRKARHVNVKIVVWYWLLVTNYTRPNKNKLSEWNVTE